MKLGGGGGSFRRSTAGFRRAGSRFPQGLKPSDLRSKLVDLRPPGDAVAHGSLGATNLPQNKHSDRPDARNRAAIAADLRLDRQTPVRDRHVLSFGLELAGIAVFGGI